MGCKWARAMNKGIIISLSLSLSLSVSAFTLQLACICNCKKQSPSEGIVPAFKKKKLSCLLRSLKVLCGAHKTPSQIPDYDR